MKVEKIGEGRYQIDGTPVDDLSSMTGAVKAIKKPLPIAACQINESFTVETTEGVMRGKVGDWLIQGVLGEMYICPADVFEKTYNILSRK
jgi:PGDYG protein